MTRLIESELRVEILSSDQFGMRGVIRVCHTPTGATVCAPYKPGYGQHKARALAFTALELILEEVTE